MHVMIVHAGVVTVRAHMWYIPNEVYLNTWPRVQAQTWVQCFLPRSCDVSFQVPIDSNIAGIHVHSSGPARIYLASLTSSRIHVVGTHPSAGLGRS